MADNPTGPELFAGASSYLDDIANGETGDPRFGEDDNRLLYATIANALAVQAQTAMLATLITAVSPDGCEPYEMDTWRAVIPLPPLKECRGKDIRRPECADRHTEDCVYVDPAPEPKHVLLDIGTRVLVSPLHSPDCTCASTQPYVGRIAGYDMSCSKYQINEECYGRPGTYYDFVKWEFATNRVEVHPDGPECPSPPKPVKREPTGPRVYVERRDGLQGHIVKTYASEHGYTWATVHWYRPGRDDMNIPLETVTIIAPSKVDRCENGQTGDECGSGENQCEPCLQAEDAEADMIEESMGLRDTPHSPGCPPIKHRH